MFGLKCRGKELTQQRVEEIASQHAGREVRLVAGAYRSAAAGEARRILADAGEVGGRVWVRLLGVRHGERSLPRFCFRTLC